MDLSIIIVSYNKKDLTTACVESIYRTCGDIKVDVIVVDNGSTDGTPEALAKNFPSITIIRNATNLGFAAANNQGMKIARGKYILLLNNDAILHSNSLQVMISFLEAHPQAGAVGPQLLNEDGTIQRSTDDEPSLRRLVLNGILNRSSYLRRRIGHLSYLHWSHESLKEVPMVIGACIMVRKVVVEAVGGLDEQFFMYLDDTDWCMRIRRAGWKIFYLPEATVTHLGGRSSDYPVRKAMFYKSMLLLSKKYYSLRSHFVARMYWGFRLWQWKRRCGQAAFWRKPS